MTAQALFAGTGLKETGSCDWGSSVRCSEPGIYVLELEDPLAVAPIDPAFVHRWIRRATAMKLDRARPTSHTLIARLERFWWPQSSVVYVGQTTKPLEKRLDDFVRHILGDPRPHRGGHWIKALRQGVPLRVRCAASSDPVEAEKNLLVKFREALVALSPELGGRPA